MAGTVRIGGVIRAFVKVESRDVKGKLLARRVLFCNDVLVELKIRMLEAVRLGSIRCAREIEIYDTVLGYSSGRQTAALTAGGTGSVNYFEKTKVFSHPGGATTYNINKSALFPAGGGTAFCERTFASVPLVPGGTITIIWHVEFNDDSGAGYDAVYTNYFLYELAKRFGMDVDGTNMECGGCDGGDIKMEYTQGGNPYDMTEPCAYVSGTAPTDTTDGTNDFQAYFTHATHNNALPTGVTLIPSDKDISHAVMIDTTLSGVPSPIDFTAGHYQTGRVRVGE